MEPTYDISIGSVPDHVREVAEKQAAALGVEWRDMLVIQRRIGEEVVSLHAAALRYNPLDTNTWDSPHDKETIIALVAQHMDPTTIRHKRRSATKPDPRQTELGQCEACEEPGTKGTACKACGGDVA